MDQELYQAWERDAAHALSGRYSAPDIELVLDWFRNIRTTRERELIGEEALAAMLVFVKAKEGFDLYHSLMARLFIYAPLILAEAGRQPPVAGNWPRRT